MRKITLDIPDALDRKIAIYLLSSDLEARDKARVMLYAIEMMMKEEAPTELKDRCRIAKDAIREKQKARWQATKEIKHEEV